MAQHESLANVDVAWLRMEDPTNLMMITGILMFDQPLDFERFQSVIEQRLLQFDRFRQRVVQPRTPFGSPVWETDPTFDLRSHVRHIALPAPHDQRALEDVVSDLMSTPLDFSKPLWQFHVIENYNGGSVVLGRLHHVIADGIALMRVLLSLTDETAAAPPHEPAPEPAAPDESAGLLRTLLKPVTNIARTVLHVTETVVQEGLETLVNPTRVLDLAALSAAGTLSLGKMVLRSPDPPTLFKGSLGVAKRVAWSAALPLADVKAVGKALGGTVNDVLLTAMTGALRRYMVDKNEDVADLNFRAAVPVNLRPLDGPIELGNKFGLVFLSLPVGIADPVERLVELKQRMDDLKHSPEAVVIFGVLNAVGMAPAEIEDLVVDLFATKVTAVMTNVPGPRQQLYLAGSPMSGIMFWVPQSGRVGLGISIISYNGQVWLGVATDAGLVPDPEHIIAAFDDEWAALQTAIAAETVPEPEPNRCVATTKAGQRCRNRAQAGSYFCHVHTV